MATRRKKTLRRKSRKLRRQRKRGGAPVAPAASATPVVPTVPAAATKKIKNAKPTYASAAASAVEQGNTVLKNANKLYKKKIKNAKNPLMEKFARLITYLEEAVAQKPPNTNSINGCIENINNNTEKVQNL